MDQLNLPSVFQQGSYVKQVVAKRLRNLETPAERKLWEKLRAGRLSGLHFRRQHIVFGFIVDFYCRPLGLVVEVDGSVHDQQQQYDRERDAIIEASGIEVIRFTNDQVMIDLPIVLSKIQTIASERKTKNQFLPLHKVMKDE